MITPMNWKFCFQFLQADHNGSNNLLNPFFYFLLIIYKHAHNLLHKILNSLTAATLPWLKQLDNIISEIILQWNPIMILMIDYTLLTNKRLMWARAANKSNRFRMFRTWLWFWFYYRYCVYLLSLLIPAPHFYTYLYFGFIVDLIIIYEVVIYG